MGFHLAQVIQPQFVATSFTPLTLVVGMGNPPPTAMAVPNQIQLSLWTCRFFNVTGSPQSLDVTRSTQGVTGPVTIVVSLTIPVASFANPYFEWDPHYQMYPGDVIYAVCGNSDAITVTGDGGITT